MVTANALGLCLRRCVRR